jgi:hydroxymethylpyrimidine pyrophosphatase-like HAD family hydrolase
MDRPPLLVENPAALDALSRVEVLYTDLDGTLLARGGSVVADADGAPSSATIEAIVALNRAQLEVVPVSGRTRLQLTEVVRLLGWTDFIAEVGSVLVRGAGPGRQVVYNTAEWPAHLVGDATPYELIRNSGALLALQECFPGRLEYHTPWHRDREASHLLRGCLDLAEAQDVLDTLDLPVSLLDNGRVHPPTHGLACLEAVHAYHLVPRGVSKSQAISMDLAARGLSASQAAAIGDSATDLAMADAVGLMALVDNAFESASVLEGLAASPSERVVRLEGRRGDGWSQFARAWLAARGASPA